MAKPKKTDTAASSRKPVSQMKAPGATAVAEAPVQATALTEEQVRLKAYEFYQQRNGNGGTPEDDWYRAEAELRGKRLRGKSA